MILYKEGLYTLNRNKQRSPEISDLEKDIYNEKEYTEFLTGGFNTVYSQKYVMPAATSMGVPSFHIKSDSPEGIRMLACLIDIIELKHLIIV